MSTKIYYGKRLKSTTLGHVKHIVVKKIKQKHKEYVYDFLKDAKTDNVCALLDVIKEFDLEFAIGFDAATNSFYGIPFGHHGVVEASTKDIDDLEDFCYFNNTDQPKDVTDEEWEQRAKIWDRICGADNGTTFGEQMFIIQIKTNVFDLIRDINERRKNEKNISN